MKGRRRIVKIRRLLFGARCAREVCAFCGHRAPLWYQWRKAREFEAGMRLLDLRRRATNRLKSSDDPYIRRQTTVVIGGVEFPARSVEISREIDARFT